MADTGFLFPGTAVGNRTISGSDDDWSDPDNIKADDAAIAQVVIGAAGETSSGLSASNFDFSGIPAGSTIDGIEVQVGDYLVDTVAGIPAWDVVKLVLADDSDGSENKLGELATWSTSPKTDQAGGASDKWGETIDLSDVQDVDWGFFVGVRGLISATTFDIDFMQMKVYYTDATPNITDVDGDETWDDGDTGLVITGTNFV